MDAASPGLLTAVAATMAQGRYLNAATAQRPVVVLGAIAAQNLGVDRILPGERVWLGGQWFDVVGIIVYAALKGWVPVVPLQAGAGGIAAALVIGACAGVFPALRAARMPPTEALRSS